MVRWAIDHRSGMRRSLQAGERARAGEIVISVSCGHGSLDEIVSWLRRQGVIGDRKGEAGAQSAPAPLLDLREGAI